MIKPRISSNPIYTEKFSHLMALQISVSEIRARYKNLKNYERWKCPYGNGYYEQIENA
jgi:hypothetical protein